MPLMRPFISCFIGQKVFFMVYEAENELFFIGYGCDHYVFCIHSLPVTILC